MTSDWCDTTDGGDDHRRDSGWHDDELAQKLCRPMDELDCELERMSEAMLPAGRRDQVASLSRFGESTVEQGRWMATFSYFSVVFGIPVFVVPFAMRDNVFAVHHSRAAGAIYLLSLVFLVLALTNCALFLPLVFLCYIPALIGIFRACSGVEAGTSALGPTGERVFGWIEVEK